MSTMKATSPSVIQTAETAHSFSALGSLPTNLTTMTRLRPRAGAPQHSPDLRSKQLTALGPSIASRALRTVARFSLVVLLGVVATLAWQSYNEEAKELLRTCGSAAWLAVTAIGSLD